MRRLGAGLLALPLLAGRASAHGGIATRFDAPVPIPVVLGGGAAVVALTALALAARDATISEPRVPVGRIPEGVARPLRLGASVGFLAALAGAVVAGLTGPPSWLDNPATLFVWAVALKGLAVVAVLVGTPWRVLAPWRTLHRALSWLEGDRIALATPGRGLAWVALAGYLALAAFENLTVVPRSPSLTVAVLAGYLLFALAGSLLVGRERFARADPLSVLYRLFGRVAPLSVERRDGGYDLALRPPWSGATDRVALGTAAFVVAAVYTVSFDGLAETAQYRTLAATVREATGIGGAVGVPLYLAGFLAFLAVFAAVAWATARTGAFAGLRGAATALAPTLVPIAAAYDLAHNLAYVLAAGARLVAVLGGPAVDPLSGVPVVAYWGAQVALIVGGHVVAVVAGHAVLGRRGHPPVTALMVGYTAVSLWVVSL